MSALLRSLSSLMVISGVDVAAARTAGTDGGGAGGGRGGADACSVPIGMVFRSDDEMRLFGGRAMIFGGAGGGGEVASTLSLSLSTSDGGGCDFGSSARTGASATFSGTF